MTRLLILLALLAPRAAFALESDFYTYNGFDETVAAFTRLGLMLSDNHFLVFATIFAIAGASLGALSTAYRGISGEQVNPVGFLIPIALGLAVFKAFVMSVGTVHIYDPVRNAYQPVGGVPDIIVAVAGGLNKLERGIIEIADTASANPYSDNAGAINFALIKSAMNASVNDWYLKQSLVNYYTACGMPALANMDTGARQRSARIDGFAERVRRVDQCRLVGGLSLSGRRHRRSALLHRRLGRHWRSQLSSDQRFHVRRRN